MKKAYILAFQKATNYGAVLQMYALKITLEKMGLYVEVIDYVPDWMKVTLKNQPSVKSYVKRKVMNFTFRNFFKSLNLTKKTFLDNESLKKNVQDGDYYFVGSDQVWNQNIMNKDSTYFLDFVPQNSKKIGYAISMGNQPFTDDFLEKVLPLIKNFDSLSVRESYVSDFIKGYYSDMKVPVVLDPTLLLEEDDYELVRSKKRFNEEFIVVYAAMHDENLYKFAKYLQEKTKLPLINLGYHFKGADKHEYIFGPGNWLNRIKEAKYIITNSFHGTVFSILYKKDFFTVPNQNPTNQGLNARFVELLQSLELNHRLIYSEKDIDILYQQPINYATALNLLAIRKQHSVKYLQQAIGLQNG